jgi:hypothetical protein
MSTAVILVRKIASLAQYYDMFSTIANEIPGSIWNKSHSA